MEYDDFVIKLVPRPKEEKKEEIIEKKLPIINYEKERIKKEKQLEKQQREQEEKNKNSIKEILNLWEFNLNRHHDNYPKPVFPIHPENHHLVNPLDVFKVVEKTFDYPDIEIPYLLLILISNIEKMIVIYDLFKTENETCHEEICNIFRQKINNFNGEWEKIILPKINKEYITETIKHLYKRYSLTINELSNDIFIDKNILKLYKITNLNSLINEIKINPEIIFKITDKDLKFFKLKEDEILKIRILFAEKNKQKRNKNLDLFLKEKLTNDLNKISIKNEIKQDKLFDKKISKKIIKMCLPLF